MQPAWSPDGRYLAWVEWDQPNMPWDGARLMLARVDGGSPAAAHAAGAERIAGGADTPVFQPEFSPDGRWLSYLAGEGEWDQLCLRDLHSGETRVLASGPLLPPAWAQGERAYAWGRERIDFIRNDLGFLSLWSAGLDGAPAQKLELDEYTYLAQPSCSPESGRLALLASSAAEIPAVVVRAAEGEPRRVYTSLEVSPDAADLPVFTPISWLAADGTRVYGLYSPPRSSAYAGSGLPPAVVYVHGGPTSQSQAAFSADAAFFTSRGYAWLAVNYRGSTGYGRSYRLALNGRWGLLDVEDACGGAQALVEQGLADPRRLALKGGSAGGYTLLNCLIRRPGLFAAGLCSYGVSDLFGLAKETHKFERAYIDGLVGPLPQSAELYRAWSPLFHVEQIVDPLAIFQGDVDKVVPRGQSDRLADSLSARGVEHVYRIYAGEGHGFRKPESLDDYYRTAEAFLAQHLRAD
jgi:dipeptidyl aminopeptidase/acylaminoacyl peptidase